jgi:hypothetical protein
MTSAAFRVCNPLCFALMGESKLPLPRSTPSPRNEASPSSDICANQKYSPDQQFSPSFSHVWVGGDVRSREKGCHSASYGDKN